MNQSRLKARGVIMASENVGRGKGGSGKSYEVKWDPRLSVVSVRY